MDISFKKKLIQVPMLAAWEPNQAKDNLLKFYESTLAIADETALWYHECGNKKGKWARSIRMIAIFCLILTTIVPYISSLFKEGSHFIYFGYIFAGIGGGMLLLDRFYGFSNSWVRFILTGMDLERCRNEFISKWQTNWLTNMPLTLEAYINLSNVILAFQSDFHLIVKAETQKWALEFQQNNEQLSALLKTQSDKFKIQLQEKADLKLSSEHQDVVEQTVTAEILQKAIDEKAEEWEHSFGGPFEAISVAPKIVNGKQGKLCIQFDVQRKIDDTQLANCVPKLIAYSSNGKKYMLPTDVVPVGTTKLTNYVPMDPSNYLTGINVSPLTLGHGCGRVSTSETGTIGLLVSKVSEPGSKYILSCYHVLCAPEVFAGVFSVNTSTDLVIESSVLSPSKEDKPDNVVERIIGTVSEGLIDPGSPSRNGIDAAIAKVINDNVSNHIYNLDNVVPNTQVFINSRHSEIRYPVQLVGRTSAFQTGTVISHYCRVGVLYPTRNEPTKRLQMQGTIKVSKISEKGDSGAIVFDSQFRVVGLNFACNDAYSYIIPLDTIFSQLNVTFYEVH